MNKENRITINNLVYALLFLVIGIILVSSTEDMVTLAAKVIGGILEVVGVVKAIIYIYMKGKLGDYSIKELLIALVIIACGTLLIVYSPALSIAIRLVVGIWALFAAVNKIILALSIRSIDITGFKVYFTTAIIMLIIAIFLISGLLDKIIGVFIILYAITEIIDYIYYRLKYKNYGFEEDKTEEKNSNSKIKKLTNKKGKVVDAVIEEDEEE